MAPAHLQVQVRTWGQRLAQRRQVPWEIHGEFCEQARPQPRPDLSVTALASLSSAWSLSFLACRMGSMGVPCGGLVPRDACAALPCPLPLHPGIWLRQSKAQPRPAVDHGLGKKA